MVYYIPGIVFAFIIVTIVIIVLCLRLGKRNHVQTETVTITHGHVPATQTTVVQQTTHVPQYHQTTYVHQQPQVVSPPPPQVVGPPPQVVSPPPQTPPCIACKSIKPLALIIPCNHECVCLDCGTMIRNQGHSCPLCNEPIESVWPK